MSFLGLLNQRVVIYAKSTYTHDGRETFGDGTVVRSRFQEQTKRKLLPNGSVLTIDAIVYFPGNTTILSDYKVVYNSVTYKVIGVYKAVDGAGRVQNIKAELVKWQV